MSLPPAPPAPTPWRRRAGAFLAAPGRRFALLVVLGMLMVATPAAELWRRQGEALLGLLQAHRGLDPLQQATHTQRALMRHRPYAAAVLAGLAEQEGERLQRQRAVDSELAGLLTAISLEKLHRAGNEAEVLRLGWSDLLEGIGARRLAVTASDVEHELLVEHTFVIADLVTMATGLQREVGRVIDADEWRLAQQLLPRLAVALDGSATPAQLQQLSRRIGVLSAALTQRSLASPASPTSAALPVSPAAADAALLASLAAVRRDTEALASAPRSDARAKAALHASIAQSTRLLVARADAALVAEARRVELERRAVAGALVIAGLIALAAVLGALRAARTGGLMPTPSPPRYDPHAAPVLAPETEAAAAHDLRTANAESTRPTHDLLQRLRDPAPPPTDRTERDAPPSRL
jgi:hypothetical protein